MGRFPGLHAEFVVSVYGPIAVVVAVRLIRQIVAVCSFGSWLLGAESGVIFLAVFCRCCSEAIIPNFHIGCGLTSLPISTKVQVLFLIVRQLLQNLFAFFSLAAAAHVVIKLTGLIAAETVISLLSQLIQRLWLSCKPLLGSCGWLPYTCSTNAVSFPELTATDVFGTI